MQNREKFVNKEYLDRFVKAGNVDVLSTILVETLDKNPELAQETENKTEETILHKFAEKHNVKLLKELFQEIRDKVNREFAKPTLLTKWTKKKNAKGYTYLAVAVNNIKVKLEDTEYIKEMDKDAKITLECMSSIFEKEVVSVLCMEKDKGGNSLFHLAVQKSLTELMTSMLSIAQNVDRIFNEDGYNPLHLAVQTTCTRMVTCILGQKGFNVNIPMPNGETALHVAAQLGDSNTLADLIEQGGDLSLIDKEDGHTPLHDCLQQVYFESRDTQENYQKFTNVWNTVVARLCDGGV